MDAIEPNVRGLLIFAILWTVCCIGAFQIAGLLPIDAKHIRTNGVIEILALIDATLVILLAGLVLAYSFKELHWSSVVVAGGFIFLFAPFATEKVPDRFKHGPLGLFTLASVLCIALGALLSAAGMNLPFLALIRT